MSDLEKVRAWLDFICERDQVIRDVVRDNCRVDPECLAYYVKCWERDCAGG